ncbi:MAG: TRAP transporter large permease subunit [Alphaproteobacteria bacterium]
MTSTVPFTPRRRPVRLAGIGRRAEDALVCAMLLAMGLLPVIEIVLRSLFETGIPGNAVYVSNLTLWVGFLGAMIAARERRHLNLAVGLGGLLARRGINLAVIGAGISAAVATGLAWSAVDLVASGIEFPYLIDDWLPEWVVLAVLPLAFVTITLRIVLAVEDRRLRLVPLLAAGAVVILALVADPSARHPLWPGLVVLTLGALLGAPIFVLLGGTALLLFFADGVPTGTVMNATYRVAISPAIATLPLFTLTGYLLAEGRTPERLVRLFRAWFGWLPGGLAVACVLVCAFFSTFTGASGVTILALGGLLLPVLLRNGYRERFSIGLLTASGSIGLLFPPSLAVIVYGVIAHISILDLFVAGIVPGLIMVGAVCCLGVRAGLLARVERPRFDFREAVRALWDARWEVLLPIVALGAIFGGYCSLPEAAAITVVYALVVQVLVRRDVHVTRDLPRILVKCAALIGGIFAILGAAMGLTSYLVDADVPTMAAEWIQQLIASRLLFLLCLNVVLLAVGCLMDVFSAAAVVLPLIIPMAAAYGIHPLHMAMIFLTNLELGYLTPPVGMNLFLAAYRFERTIGQVCGSALPFLLLLAAVVLAVTYGPLLGLVPAWR